MLKIKKSNKSSDKRNKAIKEVVKEDRKGLFVYIPESQYWKLKEHLHEERLSCTQWLSEKIEEI